MKLRTLLLAGAVTAAMILPSSALSLKVNGRDRTAEARTTLIENTTYVSLRSVAAMLDSSVQVEWTGGQAMVNTKKASLTARPGDDYIQVNDRYIYVKNGVRAADGSVLVALRPLAAALGGTVEWDAAANAAILTTGNGTPKSPEYSADDLYWLSRIISAESRGESLRGKIAVGTVVLNRVASGEFPDTIYGVIFDGRWGGQFEPVRNKTIYDEPTEESVLAAQLCLQGARAAGESLYFLAPELTQNHWIMSNRKFVETIGCHWFYQ